MKRPTLFHMIALAIPILLLMNGCGRTIDPGMRGLRWYPLSGGLDKESLKNGFYWRAPWNDVLEYDVRYQSFSEKIDALTADDLSVSLRVVITMSPIAEEVYPRMPYVSTPKSVAVYATVPRATTHCIGWSVTTAMRSKSAS